MREFFKPKNYYKINFSIYISFNKLHNKTPRNIQKVFFFCKCVKLDILEAAKKKTNSKYQKKNKKLINIEQREEEKKISKSFETTENQTSAVFMSLTL